MSEVMEIRMPAVYGDHPIVGKVCVDAMIRF